MAFEKAPALRRSDHRLLLAAGDAVAATLAVVAALWTWSLTTGYPFGLAFVGRWAGFVALGALWVIIMGPARRVRVALSLDSSIRAILAAAATVAAGYLAVYFYAPPSLLPRLPAVYFLWDATLLTLGWRLVYLYAFARGNWRRRTLFLGDPSLAASFTELARSNAPDIDVVAQVEPDTPSEALDTVVRASGAAEIVLSPSVMLSADLSSAILRWQERGLDVLPFHVEYEHILQRVPVNHLPPNWVFATLPEWVRSRDASRVAKRLVDIVSALGGLVCLAALLPFLAAAIVAESGLPVFYRQRRTGWAGTSFDVLKLRTMVNGAETSGPQWAGPNDPRATRVGRWLRRTRLDELPQVINILKGDMSLVGPRPERPEFAEALEQQIPFYRLRLMVRPGLTGWAQVNAAYGASPADASLKLEYDLYYIKHRSMLLDLWIVLRTIATVASLGGR